MINMPNPDQNVIIAAMDDGGTNPLLENDTEKLYNLACSKKLYDVVKYLESISFGYVEGTPINARSSWSTYNKNPNTEKPKGDKPQRRCKRQTGGKRNSRRKSKTRKYRR